MTGPNRNALFKAGTLTLLIAACLSGCSGDTPPPARGSSTATTTGEASTTTVSASASSSASSTVDARLEATRLAVTAYLDLWRAYEADSRAPDPGTSTLADFSADGTLSNLTSGLQYLKDHGLKSTGATTHKTTITGVAPLASPSTVKISDCMDTSATHIVRQDGKPFKDEAGGRRLTIAEIRLHPDGKWRVSTLAIRAVGTC